MLAKRGYVPIRDIRAGDHKVWARNELTGRTGWRPVLAQYSNPYEETVHVAIRDRESGAVQIIKSNRIHPFFAVRDVGRTALYTPASAPLAPPSSEGHRYSGPIKGGAWIDAQHLRKGDRLLNADESWAEVVSVSVERKNLVAYNLTVAQAHTYFVSGQAGADPVWVHNDCSKADLAEGFEELPNGDIVGAYGSYYKKNADGTYTNEGPASYAEIQESGVTIRQNPAQPEVEIIGGKTCNYVCVENGVTRYVGITDNFARRGREHMLEKGIDIERIAGLSNISRDDARAVEQMLIHYYRLGKNDGSLLNKINSISPVKNPTKYEISLIRGKELLDSVGYNWGQ